MMMMMMMMMMMKKVVEEEQARRRPFLDLIMHWCVRVGVGVGVGACVGGGHVSLEKRGEEGASRLCLFLVFCL